MPVVPLLTAAVVGYFFGAIPFGYLVARSKGINIFEHGSKNPGATNVKRVLGEKFGRKGKRAGDLVFFLDAVKGAAAAAWPLLLRFAVSGEIDLVGRCIYAPDMATPMAVVSLIGALLGHCFSCFTQFRGGKGVATAVGGLLVLMPFAILVAAAIWAAVFYSVRFVSLASILAALMLPVAAFFLKQPPLLIGLAAIVAALVTLRHRANIVRLMNGTEARFVKKSQTAGE